MRTFTRSALAALVTVGVVACQDTPQAPLPTEAAMPDEAMPGHLSPQRTAGVQPVVAGDAFVERARYLARVAPEGDDSRVRGTAHFEIRDGWFSARVRIAGLEPNERIPQHIHLNPTCQPAGGILINLDEALTVAGEGPGAGDAYPRANRGGVVQYEARRSLVELEAALQEHLELTLTDLNLDQRNVNFHEPLPPPIPSQGCGEIERIN